MHHTEPPARPAPSFSVVIPCYNELDNIATLIDEVVAAFAGRSDFEVVVVDDFSSDGTRARLVAEKQRHAGVLRVVGHSVNRGQSAAICSGIDAARGSWIVTLDGDGQNDPADIPRLLTRISAPHDAATNLIICGYRKQRRDNWIRRLSSRVANGIRARALGDATPDTGCGLKVFSRALFLQLPRFDHMHRFLPALVQRVGGTAVSVEVHHRPRLHGQSKYGVWNRLWVGIVDIFGVMWLRTRRFKPSSNEEL